MLDYKGLEALNAVITYQGFDNAAKKLCLTQSAISQRIKSLERYLGLPLLIRKLPYEATEAGTILLNHYRQTQLLESACLNRMDQKREAIKISIAINRDSLETWFQAVILEITMQNSLTIEIRADDQELTLNYLKQGLVHACLSTQEKSIIGCEVTFLGEMDYALVAAPAFIHKHFTHKKISKKNLLEAPAVIFDQNDTLHQAYLKKFFNISEKIHHYHSIPSIAGFRNITKQGLAYGLIPIIDIETELNTGALTHLFPKKIWHMPLYWHSWQLQSHVYNEFTSLVIKVAKRYFR